MLNLFEPIFMLILLLPVVEELSLVPIQTLLNLELAILSKLQTIQLSWLLKS